MGNFLDTVISTMENAKTVAHQREFDTDFFLKTAPSSLRHLANIFEQVKGFEEEVLHIAAEEFGKMCATFDLATKGDLPSFVARVRCFEDHIAVDHNMAGVQRVLRENYQDILTHLVWSNPPSGFYSPTHIREGASIKAMKELRALTGCGLRVAKSIVDKRKEMTK